MQMNGHLFILSAEKMSFIVRSVNVLFMADISEI